MDKQHVKELAQTAGFKLKQQPTGEMDLNPCVYEFAAALLEPLQESNKGLLADRSMLNERIKELESATAVMAELNETGGFHDAAAAIERDHILSAAKKKYFLYNPENGFEEYDCIKKLNGDAEDAIDGYLDDGWNEEVTGVVAGIITHRATQTDLEERPVDVDEEGIAGDGSYWSDEWDYKCNYRLAPVAPLTDANCLRIDTGSPNIKHELGGAGICFHCGSFQRIKDNLA